ncbi:MAG: DUF167 domain-containing protein [Thermoprotei archaeon]|nr:MAG: DUF167 domain-containing protein [Thermoprotei archaeon]
MNEDIRNKLIKNLYETSKGVIINVHVKPDSAIEKLTLENDDLVYYTKEPPIRGRANAALTRFLSKVLGLSVSRINIVYGTRKRFKRILVRDIDLDKLIDLLTEYLKRN